MYSTILAVIIINSIIVCFGQNILEEQRQQRHELTFKP